jgi:hypothetical protein
MTVLKPAAKPSPVIAPRDHHAADEEWTAFLAGGSQSEKFRYTLRSYRRHFVSHYPDLEDWKRRPLRERVAAKSSLKTGGQMSRRQYGRVSQPTRCGPVSTS